MRTKKKLGFVFYKTLFLEYIKPHTVQDSFLEAFYQRFCLDKHSARSVDKHTPFFHLGNIARVNNMMSLLCVREVNTHNI